MGQIEVEAVFQPIVSLDGEDTVGYEALSRWPSVGSISPESVFLAASAAGNDVLRDLDRRCISTAARTAVSADLAQGALLLINTEPTAGAVLANNDLWLTRACEQYQVVFEFTERGLSDHPRALLAKVTKLRESGIGIALDDVGHDADALFWLDVIDPDIVKLDMSLIQRQPAPAQARTLAAVYSYHERSGAIIVAEGIETAMHLDQARAAGASLGQGYLFGAPAERLAVPARGNSLGVVAPPRRRTTVTRTPFDLVTDRASIRIARRSLLWTFTRDLTAQAAQATDKPVLLAAVRHADYLLAIGAEACFEQLGEACSFIAVCGQDMPARFASMIGVALEPDDPLCAEWTLVTLGSSHTASALFARDYRDPAATSPPDEKLFEFVITTDRTLVASAAADLLARVPCTSAD